MISLSHSGVLRTVASVVPNRNVIVLYGSTEVEPISAIFGKEKQTLEGTKANGLCVGQPIVNDSVRIIAIQEGE